MRNFFNNHLIIFILIVAAFFRIYGINFDQGHYLHPDERAIIMFTQGLQWPQNFDQFLSPQSPLNPHFFAYGNFPLYLLKVLSPLLGTFDTEFSNYAEMYLVGRLLSAVADLGTIIVIFLIGKKLYGKNVGLLASFLYGVAVFPIQASHFFAVDILLTFFITLTILSLVNLSEKTSDWNTLLVGLFFGLSLVTKISSFLLIIPILYTFSFSYFTKPINVKKITRHIFIMGSITLFTFILLQPYALIDFQEFKEQNILQSKMTNDAFIFPYTLQYVGKIPYLYELKNIFFWGLGPVLAIPAFAGVFYFLKKLSKKKVILLLFFLTYFITVGKFAVGWMRYMLPIYPLLCMFAAVFILRIMEFFSSPYRFILYTLYFILIAIWPLSFIHIYSLPHTRVSATDWIQQNIPANSTLAVEHWDDRLPLSGSERYNFVELTLYDQPDNEVKWSVLNKKISQSDYIILASNRLYVPLPKLSDCTRYKMCYPKTTQYYQNLFDGSLGFRKIAEFSSNPTIPFLNIAIDDQSADEAFTVYDHPKVIIFKK